MAHSRSRRAITGKAGKRTQIRVNREIRPLERDSSWRSVSSSLAALGITALLVLGFGLVTITGHTQVSGDGATASGGGPPSGVSAGYGSLNHPKGPCGNSGQAACTAVDPAWVAVGSASPSSVAAAIMGSRDYAAISAQYGCGALDTPALVRAYGAHTGVDYYDDDHWVVSVRDATGMRCGLFDFVYDRAHQRARFSSYGVLTPQDPHARQAFPYIASSAAQGKLQSQRKLSLRPGTQPELIFFPIDPSFPTLTSPVHKWAGGGNSAMNPMWHLVGTDGRDYFVGANLGLYTQQDLPIAKGQP